MGKFGRVGCLATIVATVIVQGGPQGPSFAARLSTPKIAPLQSWRELKTPHQIYPYGGAIYYSFELESGARAHLVVINVKAGQWTFRPALAEPATASTSAVAMKNGGSAAINGGFFNLKENGQSTSYVTIDGAVAADPSTNKLLTENPKLAPYMPQILDRTEVRFVRDERGKNAIQFARHSAGLPRGYTMMHALQAGPRLLPKVTAVEEAFVRKDPDGTSTDAIGSRREAARTAFGITPDGYAMMLCICGKGQDPESSGVTLQDLADTMKQLGCSDAINLDGGSSSTMYVRLGTPGQGHAGPPPGTVVCGKNPETKVKSILMLVPAVKNK